MLLPIVNRQGFDIRFQAINNISCMHCTIHFDKKVFYNDSVNDVKISSTKKFTENNSMGVFSQGWDNLGTMSHTDHIPRKCSRCTTR